MNYLSIFLSGFEMKLVDMEKFFKAGH